VYFESIFTQIQLYSWSARKRSIFATSAYPALGHEKLLQAFFQIN